MARPRRLILLGTALAFAVVAVLGMPVGAQTTPGTTPATTIPSYHPTAVMYPDQNLTDGDVTTVSGTGWPKGANIEIIECSGTMHSLPTNTTSCDGFSADTTAQAGLDEKFVDAPTTTFDSPTNGYRIFVLPNYREKGLTIACGPKTPCVLYVGVNFEDFTQLHTFVPVNFAANAKAAPLGAPNVILHGAPPTPAGSSGTGWVVVVMIVAAVVLVGGVGMWVSRRRRRGDAAPVAR